MAEKPKTTDRNGQFMGRVSNASPHLVPLGAGVEQDNIRCQVPGQLDVRPGVRPVTFSNTTTASTAECQTGYFYNAPIGSSVIYQLSDGTIKFGKSPTV